MVDFVEVIRRTESGAFLSERDFDIEVIFKTTRELVKKHGLKYDRKQLITLEPEMADGAFQAGLELAEQAGMFCVNTSRVIQLTREELLYGLRPAPRALRLGGGRDQRTIRARVGGGLGRPLLV